VLTGSTLLDQIEIFEWSHDTKSLPSEIQDKISYDKFRGVFMELAGISAMIGGMILALVAYRRIK